MPRLSNSSKKATKSVSQKIANKTKTQPSPVSQPGKVANGDGQNLAVPGLTDLEPNQIQSMLPSFDEGRYQINDPLNPSASLPQATEAQYVQGETIYQGAIRALKLTGMALDTTKERFNVIGKRSQAFGAGIKAAKATETVKGDFLDYLNQGEINKQKAITLDINQYRTNSQASEATYIKINLDENLRQAEIEANLARLKSQDKQDKLTEFQKSLGTLTAR